MQRFTTGMQAFDIRSDNESPLSRVDFCFSVGRLSGQGRVDCVVVLLRSLGAAHTVRPAGVTYVLRITTSQILIFVRYAYAAVL